jgi:hypothetical protein
VQEVGSVLGPLYGALVLSVADWHAIFAVNLAAGLVLAAVLRAAAGRTVGHVHPGRPSPVGLLLLGLALAAMVLAMVSPPRLASDVTIGLGFVPLVGGSRWLAPVGLAAVLLCLGFVAHCLTSRRPVLHLRQWADVGRRADLLGATLLGAALSGVVLAFATADPEVAVLSPVGPWLLLGSAASAVLLVVHLRRAPDPLLPRGAVAGRGAWGPLVVNLFVGAALIAALVDVPLFARITVYPASQLDAALVLLRFLVALPLGALLGGYATRHVPPGVLTAAGMLLATGGFVVMSTWGLTSLRDAAATVPLVVAGLGFGLAVAPVNASLLAATDAAVHGVSSAMLVVARMVGMLVGISALTTIGLRRYYAVQADLPAPTDVCPSGTQCAAYTRLLKEAGLEQLHAVFLGAAVCAVVAAVAALLTLRDAGDASGTLPRWTTPSTTSSPPTATSPPRTI